MDADISLAEVADRYRTVLDGGDLREVDLTPYDRTGIPTVATSWVRGAAAAHGIGFGASAAAATVGALGELSEDALSAPVVTALPRRRAGYAELVAELGPDGVADPLTLVLPAGCDYSPARPLDWVPMTRWRTGEPVLVPMEFVAPQDALLPADPPPGGWLTTAITNGMGAGTSLEQAVAHGVLEVIQRDGDTVSYRALDTGVVIDLSASRDERITTLLARYRAAGVEPVVKLASTEFATVVYCAGRDEHPDTPPLAVTAIGEAADLDRDAAIAKALLEFGSSRARKIFSFGPLADVEARDPEYLRAELAAPVGAQEPRALAQMTAWSSMSAAELTALVAPTLLRQDALIPVDQVPTAARPGTSPALLDVLLERLHDFDVLVLAGGEGPIRACKVLIPGLEVETMSYQRIGERVLSRLLARGAGEPGADLVGRGPATRPQQLAIHLSDAATERVGGPAWLDREVLDRTVGRLYPLYREPDRHAMQRLAAGV